MDVIRFIYTFKTWVYIQRHVYMAEYGYKYPYIQHLDAQNVLETPSQRIHTQETGVCYSNLIQLQCSATQLPRGGLQHQPRYFVTW